jgi:biotin-dependent carboxylase-like uncharacterized protein
VIEILSNGALNVVQDLGRPEHLPLGVSTSGAMDAPALVLANWLAGNDEGAAGIELGIFPFRVRFLRPARFACTGATASLRLPARNASTWWSGTAQQGDVLVIEPPVLGARAYLAIQGGIDVPPVLGARATDLKSGFGGLDGRGLRKGDRLELGPSGESHGPARPIGIAPPSRLRFADELATGTATIRVLAGAEHPQFTREAVQAFEHTPYRLTPDCNRQGYRLEGAPLKTRRPLELLSHGIVPGTVQVPPSGQPILQLAEANTCGGYPKIGAVIEPDLWRLAQLRPGQQVRFEVVDHATALGAVREHAQELERLRLAIAARSA